MYFYTGDGVFRKYRGKSADVVITKLCPEEKRQ